MKLTVNVFFILVTLIGLSSYGQNDTIRYSNGILIESNFCQYLNDSQSFTGKNIYISIPEFRDTACLYQFLEQYQGRITRINERVNYRYQYKGLKFPNLEIYANLPIHNSRPKRNQCQSSDYEFLTHSKRLSALLIMVNCDKDFQIIEEFVNLWTLRVYIPRTLEYPEGFRLRSDSLVELHLEDFRVDKHSIQWIDNLEKLDVFYITNFKYKDRCEIFKSQKIRHDLKEFKKTRFLKRYYLRKKVEV